MLKYNYKPERTLPNAFNATRNAKTSPTKWIIQVGQNGSHIKMRNLQTGKQTEVPYHSLTLKKGLEQAILKQAGLK